MQRETKKMMRDLKVEEPDLTPAQRRSRKDEITKKLSKAMAEKLANCGAMASLCRTFVARFETQCEAGAALMAAYDRYMENRWGEGLLRDLDDCEAKWMETEEYKTLLGHPQQNKMLQALDYYNRLTQDAEITWFDICRAKKWDGSTCGCFMSADLWYQPS